MSIAAIRSRLARNPVEAGMFAAASIAFGVYLLAFDGGTALLSSIHVFTSNV